METNYQIKLLHNIKTLIDKIDYYINKNITKYISKDIHNEITNYFSKKVLSKLSCDKINFDV